MLGKIVLAITAIALISYGLVCFFFPEIPAGYIGFDLTNADARIEVVAMYGGLEVGVGLFCLLGLLKPELYKASLLFVILGLGGIAIGRIFGLVLTSEPVTGYTYGAMCYEICSSVLAAVALRMAK
jgi:hypothetical protein